MITLSIIVFVVGALLNQREMKTFFVILLFHAIDA